MRCSRSSAYDVVSDAINEHFSFHVDALVRTRQ